MTIKPAAIDASPCQVVWFQLNPAPSGVSVQWEIDPKDDAGAITPNGVFIAPEMFPEKLGTVIVTARVGNDAPIKAFIRMSRAAGAYICAEYPGRLGDNTVNKFVLRSAPPTAKPTWATAGPGGIDAASGVYTPPNPLPIEPSHVTITAEYEDHSKKSQTARATFPLATLPPASAYGASLWLEGAIGCGGLALGVLATLLGLRLSGGKRSDPTNDPAKQGTAFIAEELDRKLKPVVDKLSALDALAQNVANLHSVADGIPGELKGLPDLVCQALAQREQEAETKRREEERQQLLARLDALERREIVILGREVVSVADKAPGQAEHVDEIGRYRQLVKLTDETRTAMNSGTPPPASLDQLEKDWTSESEKRNPARFISLLRAAERQNIPLDRLLTSLGLERVPVQKGARITLGEFEDFEVKNTEGAGTIFEVAEILAQGYREKTGAVIEKPLIVVGARS